ncbi:Ras-Related Protein Rab-40C, partial [Manis pentadactyla]
IDYKTTTILLDGRRVKLELWGSFWYMTSPTAGPFDGIDRWIREIDEPAVQLQRHESFTELSRIVLMRHGMEKIWRPNEAHWTLGPRPAHGSLPASIWARHSVQPAGPLLGRRSSPAPPHPIDKLPLPVTIKSHLKSFSMANGMNAVMMHGRSYRWPVGLGRQCKCNSAFDLPIALYELKSDLLAQ